MMHGFVHAFMLLLIGVAVKSDNAYKIRLKLNLPRQNIRPHAPVTGEAIEGVFEGGGAVMFEEEVPHPSKGITLQQRDQYEAAISGE
jgi:hypothetical protein